MSDKYELPIEDGFSSCSTSPLLSNDSTDLWSKIIMFEAYIEGLKLIIPKYRSTYNKIYEILCEISVMTDRKEKLQKQLNHLTNKTYQYDPNDTAETVGSFKCNPEQANDYRKCDGEVPTENLTEVVGSSQD
jgi:hypothetical protein